MTRKQTPLEDQPNSDLDQESQIQETSIDLGMRVAERTKTVHITLQGKGGIGKSFVSVMLAQYPKQHDPGVLLGVLIR